MHKGNIAHKISILARNVFQKRSVEQKSKTYLGSCVNVYNITAHKGFYHMTKKCQSCLNKTIQHLYQNTLSTPISETVPWCVSRAMIKEKINQKYKRLYIRRESKFNNVNMQNRDSFAESGIAVLLGSRRT